MADLGRKRRFSSTLEDAAKRLRIESELPPGNPTQSDEKDDDCRSVCSNELGSEDDIPQTAETPLTPFSPARKHPSDLKTIKCTYEGCTKAFNRPARLVSHLRSHTNERPFICTYQGCDKTYMEEKHLKQHVKGSHTHEKLYQCDWEGCSKSFVTSTRLKRHLDVHEGRERFRCTAYPPCDKTFRKHQTLQQHIRADHLQLAAFPCTNFDDSTQATCDAEFDSATSLRKHQDRVHGALQFWCEECSNGDEAQQQVGFRTKNEFSKHIRTEHSNCIFCDLKCNNQAQLEKHIETHHCSNSAAKLKDNLAERKTFSCPNAGCLKMFTKNSNLAAHIRTAHDGERFVCSLSAAAYPFKSSEVLSWTGHNACGKDFVSKVNLEDHIRTQHLGLPSVTNAKKIKGRSSRKKEGAKPPPTDGNDLDIINALTGAGYGQNQSRNIPCLIMGCEWLFIRQYDLQMHLKCKHNLSTAAIEKATTSPNIDPYDRDTMDQMYDQADLEWEIQAREQAAEKHNFEEEDTPLWTGTGKEDKDEEAGRADGWFYEEMEMRSLIDRVPNNGSFDDLIDPMLEAI